MEKVRKKSISVHTVQCEKKLRSSQVQKNFVKLIKLICIGFTINGKNLSNKKQAIFAKKVDYGRFRSVDLKSTLRSVAENRPRPT